ncbi:tautomerase family protein [Staphylococcus shinii]|uniref:tautomerase family protein n=1 Tax=Staphylococcus shinii TaxID=2912228 RepID=UPI0035152F16
MPIIKIDIFKGRTEEEIKQILDISYEVMLDSFQAPVGDKYQIVTQHENFEMEILDTGLGISRTKNIIVFTLITRPRTKSQKVNFYRNLANSLNTILGVRKEDIMINLVENTDEDWSFFGGEAQFLNGSL